VKVLYIVLWVLGVLLFSLGILAFTVEKSSEYSYIDFLDDLAIEHKDYESMSQEEIDMRYEDYLEDMRSGGRTVYTACFIMGVAMIVAGIGIFTFKNIENKAKYPNENRA